MWNLEKWYRGSSFQGRYFRILPEEKQGSCLRYEFYLLFRYPRLGLCPCFSGLDDTDKSYPVSAAHHSTVLRL